MAAKNNLKPAGDATGDDILSDVERAMIVRMRDLVGRISSEAFALPAGDQQHHIAARVMDAMERAGTSTPFGLLVGKYLSDEVRRRMTQ